MSTSDTVVARSRLASRLATIKSDCRIYTHLINTRSKDQHVMNLPDDRMSEAEVSLRLAFQLLTYPLSHGRAVVAIDGAQVSVCLL